jgi:hypothetical protein
MYNNNSSRVFPIVLVLIVIAIVIAALVSVGRMIFGGDTSTTQSQTNAGRDALLDTATDRSVRMTVRGPIVADENFRLYRVIANPNSRKMTTYSGYLDNEIRTKSYANNSKAYEEFVYALDKANLMKGEELADEKDDTRGICATGRVYEFEILEGKEVVKHLWTSTCKGSPGSLKASVSQVEALFVSQIKDSRELLKTVDF